MGEGNRTLLWLGVCLGVGAAGTLDAVLLHQLLQWHTLYVHTTLYWRTFIDGVFHLVTAGLLFAGALLLFRHRELLARSKVRPLALGAGLFMGMGGFNLFDGIVNHKVLRLHPVREGAQNLLPYDAVYIGTALVVFLIGWALRARVRREAARVAQR